MATDLKETDLKESAEKDQIGEINKYNFRTETTGVFKAKKGLNAEVVNQISDIKGEPDWMREFRLKSLEMFEARPMPKWGGGIDIDFQDIYYYLKPTDKQSHAWDDVPEEIRKTFEKLGIPDAEQRFLSGVKAQFESEVVYGSLKEDLHKQGVRAAATRTRISRLPSKTRPSATRRVSRELVRNNCST